MRYRPRDLAHRHLEGIREIADLLPGFLSRPQFQRFLIGPEQLGLRQLLLQLVRGTDDLADLVLAAKAPQIEIELILRQRAHRIADVDQRSGDLPHQEKCQRERGQRHDAGDAKHHPEPRLETVNAHGQQPVELGRGRLPERIRGREHLARQRGQLRQIDLLAGRVVAHGHRGRFQLRGEFVGHLREALPGLLEIGARRAVGVALERGFERSARSARRVVEQGQLHDHVGLLVVVQRRGIDALPNSEWITPIRSTSSGSLMVMTSIT